MIYVHFIIRISCLMMHSSCLLFIHIQVPFNFRQKQNLGCTSACSSACTLACFQVAHLYALQAAHLPALQVAHLHAVYLNALQAVYLLGDSALACTATTVHSTPGLKHVAIFQGSLFLGKFSKRNVVQRLLHYQPGDLVTLGSRTVGAGSLGELSFLSFPQQTPAF